MKSEKQTHHLVFDGCSIRYTEVTKALAAEKHIFPIIRRIAVAQQCHCLHGQPQQLWFLTRLHGSWFQARVYSPQLVLLLDMCMKGLVVAAAEVYLWYDDGVLMLPDEE